MLSIRSGTLILSAWVMIASVVANVTFVSFKLSNISNKLSFYDKVLGVVTVMSALECSCVCSRTPSCDGYKFHTTNKTCHTLATSEADVTGNRNSVSKFTSCTSEETAENLLWKLMSREMKAQQATEYLGCYLDSFIRKLKDLHTVSRLMTKEMCIETCRSGGFKYAGSEHGIHCFCGHSPRKYSKKPEQECNESCAGNPKQICGGPWRLSVYKINF